MSAYRLPRDFKSNSTAGRHDGGSRGRCALCKAKTHWYCLGCHAFFCANPTKLGAGEKNKDYTDILSVKGVRDIEGGDVLIWNSCYLQAHPHMLEHSESSPTICQTLFRDDE